MNEKKKFLIPEIEIISFDNEDILTKSGEELDGDMGDISLGDIPF